MSSDAAGCSKDGKEDRKTGGSVSQRGVERENGERRGARLEGDAVLQDGRCAGLSDWLIISAAGSLLLPPSLPEA